MQETISYVVMTSIHWKRRHRRTGLMKKLDILPFGTQYYRAPTPLPTEWASDMKNMQNAGLNTIKIWAQWRWNHPAEDECDFSDLDGLMDEAGKNGLKVVINTIFDVAPAWLYRKHPDCVMMFADGRRLGPVTISYRQIGGAPGPCFHHPEAMEHAERWLHQLAERYKDHPALLLWDLWNEPEITVGLAREAKVENLVCYCDNSRAAFIKWLEAKYGSIYGLNAAWNRNYRVWDDVELPIRPETFKDMVDWRMFFVDTLSGEMAKRAQIVREHDLKHPVMCHTVPSPIFNPISCASDDWALAEPCDVFGNSVGSDPFPADMLCSAARGKMVINAEIHAIPGGTFSRPAPIGLEEMKRHILIPLSHGIKGFLFWQYRPERLGAESPAWGLTFPDGSPAPWLEPVSRICSELTENSDFFLNAERIAPQVAMLVSPENQVFCWAGSRSTHIHDMSIAGVYRALHRANYSIDCLHPRDIASGVLDNHKILYIPLPYWLDKSTLTVIRQWVEQGGNLISECFFAGMETETGLHSTVVPGEGFDQVFGVREEVTYPSSRGFNSYTWSAEENGCELWMEMARDCRKSTKLSRIPGHLALTTLVPVSGCDVDVIACLPTGKMGITRSRYGKGTATMIGTLLGAAYSASGDTRCAQLISDLVGQCDPLPRPKARPYGEVRVDVLWDGKRRWMLVQNLAGDNIKAVIKLPSGQPEEVREMFSQNSCDVTPEGITVQLEPYQVQSYWLE